MNSKDFERKQSIKKNLRRQATVTSAIQPHVRGIGPVYGLSGVLLFSLARGTIKGASFADKSPYGLSAQIRTRRTGFVVDKMPEFVLAFGSVGRDEVTHAGAAVHDGIGQHVLHHIIQAPDRRSL